MNCFFIAQYKNVGTMSSIGHCTWETQDDLLRIAINLPEFWWIPKAGHIANYSKAESTVRSGMLHYSTTQFVNVSLCCYSIRREIYLLRCSFSLKFLVQSSIKNVHIQKWPVKMTGKTIVWPVKSAIRPDIVRLPDVIFSPVLTISYLQ